MKSAVGGCQPTWRHWVDNVLDVLLPRVCIACGGPCGDLGLCAPCAADLPVILRPCPGCGMPLPGPDDPGCGPCLARPPPFHRVRAPFRYDFPVDRLVQRFKYQGDVAAGRSLALAAAGRLDGAVPDALIPVPLHWTRLWRRGFNPAGELAATLGRARHVPVCHRGLVRQRRTPTQAGLDAPARRRNVRGAFAWRARRPPPRHVALVDDVLTTGATAAACAGVLLRAGAERVELWAVARAVGGAE
jgi:ComF family protein